MRKLFSISVLLFLLLLIPVSQINFPLNDDWVYTKNVSNFLKGDFRLDPYISPTFYTQGIIATLFALLFGLNKLPYLTLIVSIINFFIFGVILLKKLKLNSLLSILLALLYLFNPLNLYSIFGFMTEQYFMFFLLCSIYLFLTYEETKKPVFLFLTFLMSFLGLNIRQVALVIPLSISLYFLYSFKDKFKLKAGLVSMGVFAAFYMYYTFLFPQTDRMESIPLILSNLMRTDYSIAVIIGTLVVLAAFILPILINFEFKKSHIIYIVVLTAIFYFVINYFFKPMEIGAGEFPYFQNTFQKTGFYPGNLSGTKYHFKGSYDLFKYWDIFAKGALSIFLAGLIVLKKRIINFYSIFIISYLFILIITQPIYDRYLLVLIPIVMLYALTLNPPYNLLTKVGLSVFLVFLIFLGYQFSFDFLMANKYVWNKSLELSKSENFTKKSIEGTNPWKLSYRNFEKDYIYRFSYDSPNVNEEFKDYYEVVEEKSISFPVNIWVNPKIYLYKKIN